jgi:hypothetical protein
MREKMAMKKSMRGRGKVRVTQYGNTDPLKGTFQGTRVRGNINP